MKTLTKDQHHNEQQIFFLKIKKVLRDHAEDIQHQAMLEHAKADGNEIIPEKRRDRHFRINIRIITALAAHIDTIHKGKTVFKKLGEQLGNETLKDGMSIKQAVNGTIFQKHAILKHFETSGLLDEASARCFYHFCQIAENYYGILESEIALVYNRHLVEKNRRSEERFRALIEQSADAIALVNVHGKVLYTSPRTKSLMGYSAEEFLKLNNPFELVPPDDRKQVTKIFQKLLRNHGTTEHVVYRVRHKNGKQIWIESAMTNLLHDPSVGAVVLNYHDISERKVLEAQKDDFISIATHELKTPVTSIKAYTQILQHRFEKVGNEEAAQMLKKMDTQLNKLTGLIRDLLDATRIDAGKLQFRQRLFDFNQMVSDIVDEMQLTTNEHAIQKKFGQTAGVYGDRDRIGQVVTNLLSNAIKYSPNNKKIIVTTEVNKDRSHITLRIKDFGVGIPKNKQAHVFKRFFRIGDAGDASGGLGLGLYISSEIVRRHGGNIWVESSKGRGSVFGFTIPVKQESHHVEEYKKYPPNSRAEKEKIYA